MRLEDVLEKTSELMALRREYRDLAAGLELLESTSLAMGKGSSLLTALHKGVADRMKAVDREMAKLEEALGVDE